MAKSKKDSGITSCIKAKPLILLHHTLNQRIPEFKGVSYPPPCTISQQNFDIIQGCLFQLAIRARFEFTGHPAYHLFNDQRFDGYRKAFWQPILKTKYPIYIISPLFGVMWPGDRFGPYDITMEDTFILWKKKQLWRLILEFYEKNNCDCVVSYLPRLYDNIVRLEDTPWFLFEPNNIIDHMDIFLKLARNTENNSETHYYE